MPKSGIDDDGGSDGRVCTGARSVSTTSRSDTVAPERPCPGRLSCGPAGAGNGLEEHPWDLVHVLVYGEGRDFELALQKVSSLDALDLAWAASDRCKGRSPYDWLGLGVRPYDYYHCWARP